MSKSKSMNKPHRMVSLSWMVVAAAALAACGGSDDKDHNPVEKAAKIDETVVADFIKMAALAADGVCKTAPAAGVSPLKAAVLAQNRLMLPERWQARASKSAVMVSKPADKIGECGGRITHPTYEHASGTTKSSLAFEGFCMKLEKGNTRTINGKASYVSTGKPGPSGPVVSQIEATVPDLNIVVKTGPANVATQDYKLAEAGKVLSSMNYKVDQFKLVYGVPGESPTKANPDEYNVNELRVTNVIAGETSRLGKLTVKTYKTADGGEVKTVNGRAYTAKGQYYDIVTISPLVDNKAGDALSGQLELRGAEGSKLVLAQGTGKDAGKRVVSVNGKPYDPGLVCSDPTAKP